MASHSGLFGLASNIDADEWVKALAGDGTAAVVIAGLAATHKKSDD